MKFLYPLKDTNVVPRPVTNAEVAEEFCDHIGDLTAKQAAAAANRTVPAAKKWKAKAQAPDSASLINAARRRPRVRAWLMWKIGGDPTLIRSPQVLTELYDLLTRVSAGPGHEAEEARRLFNEIFRPSAGPEASAHGGPRQASSSCSDDEVFDSSSLNAGGVHDGVSGNFRDRGR